MQGARRMIPQTANKPSVPTAPAVTNRARHDSRHPLLWYAI